MRFATALRSFVRQPRFLLVLGLLVLSFGVLAAGRIPTGPQSTTAAEPRAAAAPLTSPRPSDRQVTKVVTTLMKREHLSKHALDDEISRRGLQLYIKSLDGMKLYFYQSDVDDFMRQQDSLDDMVNAGDIGFSYTVFNILLKRIDERVALVDTLLKEKFDFTADEALVTDPDKLHFPKTPEEAADRWRKRLKYDMLLLEAENAEKAKQDKEKGKEVKIEDPRERLSRRYHSFAKRMHQTDADEVLEMYLTSITSSYDPHTTYMSPSSLENFQILMSLNLEGIGAQLQVTDGFTTINKVIPGGAAEKSGQIKVEDRIVSVGQGEEGDMVDVVDMKLNDVVQLIRGRAGSVVRLGITPSAGGDMKIVKIVRQKVELKDSEARGVIFEDGQKDDGMPYRIGVIDLPSFYMDMAGAKDGGQDFKSTTRDVKKILDDFRSKHVDALILDLRRNGGGSLTEAINLTGLFIDAGPVVQVKGTEDRVQGFDDVDRNMQWKGPLVVLTSRLSASASEILAGAIQDYHRGLIVGDTSTHGKGTVQSLLDLGPQMFRIANPPNLGALKLTMQQFYRPNGDSTQKKGVLSDITLPSLTDHMDVKESDLDYPIEFDQVPAAQFNSYDDVTPALVAKLTDKSTRRLQGSADFKKLDVNIQRYVEQKEKKEVPLNEEKFKARRAELDAEREDEKTFEGQANAPDEVVKRDYYFNEVMAITLDYMQLLGKEKVARAGR